MVEPVEYSRLYPDAAAFLNELAAQNSREWFQSNKSRYDAQLKRPAERLLADIGHWLTADIGVEPRRKLFRPHRDLRFSEDKTPYHTHLHMMWSLPDGRVWMLGISPDYATLGAGIMAFESAQADRWRAALDGPEGDDLAALLAAQGWRCDPPELQRVPAPYPADHRHAALLRRKGLVAWQDNLESALTEDLPGTLRSTMGAFRPLIDWLARVA